MTFTYFPQGTCSRQIDIDVEDGLVRDIRFAGGCHGNLQGLAALARGQRPADLIARLAGIRCGAKPTSCPDQLARALSQLLRQTER